MEDSDLFDLPASEDDGKCPFCNLKKITPWYYEGAGYKIIKCVTCGRPMIVYDKHLPKPDHTAMCESYGMMFELFGDDSILDRTMSQWPEHCHIHIVKKKKKKAGPSIIKRRDRGQIVKIIDKGKTTKWRRQ